ncbi:MAG: hypothetical protein R2747_17130 [Pyrinomonadaceae bacterium]
MDAKGDVDTAKNTGNIARQTLSFNDLTGDVAELKIRFSFIV